MHKDRVVQANGVAPLPRNLRIRQSRDTHHRGSRQLHALIRVQVPRTARITSITLTSAVAVGRAYEDSDFDATEESAWGIDRCAHRSNCNLAERYQELAKSRNMTQLSKQPA